METEIENKQQRLGSSFEEKVRNYFLSHKYFVLRGIIYKDGLNDITDIDIWGYRNLDLYSYERIFVDCKNKKKPKMAERLLWTIGLKHSISVEKAFLAVNTANYQFQEFAVKNNIIVLDNNVLNQDIHFDRKTDEEMIQMFNNNDLLGNPSRDCFERLKTFALGKIEIKNLNSTLYELKNNIEKHIINPNEASLRLTLFNVSIFFLILDMLYMKYLNISKDFSLQKIMDGIQYGDDINRIKQIAKVLSKTTSQSYNTIFESLVSEGSKNIDIIKDIIDRGNYFEVACSFENLAYNNVLILPTQEKAILMILTDYFGLSRSDFKFDNFQR